MRGLSDFLDREAITFMSSVPSFWKVAMRLSEPPERIPPPRPCRLGAAVDRAVARDRPMDRHRARLQHVRHDRNRELDRRRLARRADAGDGLVGRAWGGAFGVLGEDGDIAERRGEVLMNSPSIMLGFHDMADKTAEAFQGSWFRTGDIGEIDAEGRLRLVGRIKNEINRGGIKIPAEEIDMLLERHPDVAEACAFGLPDPVSGETVAVAIVMRPALPARRGDQGMVPAAHPRRSRAVADVPACRNTAERARQDRAERRARSRAFLRAAAE